MRTRTAITSIIATALAVSTHAQLIQVRVRELTGQSTWSGGADNVLDFQVEASVTPATPNVGIASLAFSIVLDCESEERGTLRVLRVSNADGSVYIGTPTASTTGGTFAGVAFPFRAVVSVDATANGLINTSGGTHTNNVTAQDIGAIRAETGGQFLLRFTDGDLNGVPDTSTDGMTATLSASAGPTFGSNGNWTPVYRFRYTTNLPTCREPIVFRVIPSSATTFSMMSNVGGVWQPDTQPA